VGGDGKEKPANSNGYGLQRNNRTNPDYDLVAMQTTKLHI